MKPIRELNIVVGLCQREGKILLIQRKDGNLMWDKKWEFPGGKIESGEIPEEAIDREIREETGLQILKKVFFKLHIHDWKLDKEVLRVKIHCFDCQVGEGCIKLEAEKAYQFQWFSPEEALQTDGLEANKDILKLFFHETSSS